MKKTILTTSLFVYVFSSSINIFAVDILPKKSKYYYELGGGSNINLQPPSISRTINLGGYANADLGYTCSGFNPSISISNTFNNLRDTAIDLKGDIVNSATSAMGAMPMYSLSKANPELYNMIQNGYNSAMESFKISMKDCDTALSDIKKGKSPYEDWFSISDSQGWLDGFNSAKDPNQKVDINKVSKNNTIEHRKKGIPWIHDQRSGGKNQTPINVIQDVVIAGYNAIAKDESFLDRALDSEKAAPKGSSLLKYWETPVKAGEFAKYVLGDITITADKKQDKNTSAGMGFTGILNSCPFSTEDIKDELKFNNITCTKKVKQTLIELVQTDERPTYSKLKSVSAGNLMISDDILQSIKTMNDVNKFITISKLSEDIAMQNLVEGGLLLRRLLIAGSQTKPVQNLEPALKAVTKTISYLDTELNNLSFEHDIRRKFSSNTINSIMRETHIKQSAAINSQNASKTLDIDTGAVYSREGGSSL